MTKKRQNQIRELLKATFAARDAQRVLATKLADLPDTYGKAFEIFRGGMQAKVLMSLNGDRLTEKEQQALADLIEVAKEFAT